MQIQIINIAQTQAMTKANKPYTVVEATFKNLTFQGKVEAKKIMPFGENSNAHKALINAQNGDVFDVQVVKNSAGYNDWVAVTPGQAGAEVAQSVPSNATSRPAQAGQVATNSPARTSTYETPEERAKKQVYIVRQSGLNTAVAALSVGAKSPLKFEDVSAWARQAEAYVFDTGAKQEAKDDTGFDDMSDDIPY